MRLFDNVGRGDGHHLVSARVHIAHEPLDVAALAGGIPAFEEDDDRYAAEINLVLQIPQTFLIVIHLLLVCFRVDGLRKIDLFENARTALQPFVQMARGWCRSIFSFPRRRCAARAP